MLGDLIEIAVRETVKEITRPITIAEIVTETILDLEDES